MASPREVQLRIKSVKNISQVTRALQAVSASKVQKSMQAMMRTRPYASKAWQVLTHIALQPGKTNLHPLLVEHEEIKTTLVIMISGDRGLAGAYNTNIIRYTLKRFHNHPNPVKYITIGRKGRDLLLRRSLKVFAEFSDLPAAPAFQDVSAIGRLAVDEFLAENIGEVYLVYTNFINMIRQVPETKRLLPLKVDDGVERTEQFNSNKGSVGAAYIYEPSQEQILDVIIPRFTALQVYQAVMESLASEHAARMVAMKNASENATELASALQLEYNKARQQLITSEMMDIAGGAEALTQG